MAALPILKIYQMILNKKEYIENLNIDELVQLFQMLLPNMGLSEIRRTSETCLEAEINVTNAGKYVNCYLFFNQP